MEAKFELDGQPRIIIWINLVGPKSQMLHTKSQWTSGSGEKYTIYGLS